MILIGNAVSVARILGGYVYFVVGVIHQIFNNVIVQAIKKIQLLERNKGQINKNEEYSFGELKVLVAE